MRSLVAAAALIAIANPSLLAQEWDAAKLAKGWSRLDPIDGSGTFHDAVGRRLVIWAPGVGMLRTIDISRHDAVPERWVVDNEKVWVVSGTSLKQYTLSGPQWGSFTLPAEVADMELTPSDGVYICYKTVDPYIEKRNIKTGSVLWSYGKKPRQGDLSTRALHRMVVNDEKNVLLISREAMSMVVIDRDKGSALGEALFTYNDKLPPPLKLGDKERTPVVRWFGKGVVFQAIPASSFPGLGLQGLALARFDTTASAVEFLPTQVTEDHLLVGIHEDRAVFIAPGGGLFFVPIR